MVDYGNKMLGSIKLLQEVISQAANYLLTKSKASFSPATTQYFDLDDARSLAWGVPVQTVVQVGDAPSRVVFYNSHARRRQELVTLRVSRAEVRVYVMAMLDDQEEEETQPSQLSPVFRADGEISNEEFELTFLVTVPALGLQSYYLRELKSEDGPNDEMSVAKIKIFNTKSQPFQVIFICNFSQISHWALIWYWDHLKNFIAEIPQGPLGMSIGTIWVTQKRFQGPPARGF